jgi:precorrin-6Y C5,15-methyltransferase (decarboxylating)
VTTPWLSVIGIGEDGVDGLSVAARALLDNAEIIIGGSRHLALLPPSAAECLTWGPSLGAALDDLERRRGRPICILASGDPMWFGIGVTLARRFGAAAIHVLPHPGAFSLAAARLGWPLQEVACVSAHGRPLDAVGRELHPGRRLLILAEDGTTPGRLAALLRCQGFAPTPMHVFERHRGRLDRRGGRPAEHHRRRGDRRTGRHAVVRHPRTAGRGLSA